MSSIRVGGRGLRAALAVMVITSATIAPAAAKVGAIGDSASIGIAAPAAPVDWNKVANDTLLAVGQPPHVYQIHMAMVHGAVYDAVNAIDGGHQPYLGAPDAESWYSQDAATAAAAYRVLLSIAPSQSAALDTAYTAALAAIPDGAAEDGGVATGEAAAAAMIAARTGDGRFGAPGFPTGSEPGEWRPVLPAFVNDPNAWVADVTPFLIEDASQFRSDGPNPMTSKAYAEEFNEVKSVGAFSSTRRTAAQTEALRFWGEGHPLALWSAMFRGLATDHDLSTADAARFFGMLYLTSADAAIACWDDKRHWGFWRPITAIRQADTDGNPATVADPTWLPRLATPPYPDHPSAHACISGSIAYTLQDFFGRDRVTFGTTNPANGISRELGSFHGAIKEIIDARVWAGLHFRTADVQGSIIGKKVAHWREKHYFEPVD